MPQRGEEAHDERQFGPYRLSQLIATGGMAEIHLAKTRGIEGFEKYVALKMIHPNFSSDEHFIQMLIDEAKISVQLQHVNIAHTFDLGRVGDTYYIAMEYVDGSDLFRILRKSSEQDRYMPIESAVHIAKEVANGLDYAHRKRDASGRSMGIVHRDISPQNVLISTAGEVKIVDFGIAKATMRAKQTAVGVIKGKYYYMSPEQAWGDPLDHRTDIFSSGILLYEMLTGQMLYLEEDLTKLLDMVRRADIPPPSTKRREIPRELDRIVMRALAKKPDLRFQTAQDYAAELEKFTHTFAPDFTASRLATYVGEVLGPPVLKKAEPRKPVVEDVSPRVTRGIERRSIVLSRSEFTDENSIIYNANEGPPPPRGAGVVTGRMQTPHTLAPPARLSGNVAVQRPQRSTGPVPAQRPSGQVPAQRSSGQVPAQRSSGQVPAQRPPGAGASPPAFPANRLTTPSAMPLPRPPPLPPTLPPIDGPVKPLAARLAAAASAPVMPDRGTIDIDDVDLEAVEEDLEEEAGDKAALPERSVDNTAERTADVAKPISEPPPDEEPTVLDVAGLAARARVSATRPMEPASAPRMSSTRPIEPVAVAQTEVAPVPPPASQSPRPSKRTPLEGVPILKQPEPPPPTGGSGSSLPLAAPSEPTGEHVAPITAASSVWPPRGTAEEEGEELFGFKIGARVSKKQVLLALFAVAGLVGLGALAVAVFSQSSAPQYATVDVISIPAHARVLVDNRELGVTPLTLERVPVQKPLKLRVELPQHDPWEREEQISEARHVKVVASLKAILGTLHVDSNPVGAEVFFNNRSVGSTPLERTDMTPFVDGTVEVRKQGYRPSRQTLEWKGGREVKLSFDLVPAKE